MSAEEMIKEILYNFGFPVFVVLWFMFRTEGILKQNTQAIRLLTELIKRNL